MKLLLRRHGRPLLAGAVSGCVTVLAFTVLHDLLISDIWFSLVPMLIAGAACGASLGWSHGLLFAPPSARSWLLYNLAHLAGLVGLGIASVLYFEPVVSMVAMITSSAPPDELFAQAMPLTVAWTLVTVGALSAMWGRTPAKAAALLLTTIILVGLLGLNIAVLGLVEMDGESLRPLWLFFELTVLIVLGNATVFLLLERRRLAPLPYSEGQPARGTTTP